MLCIGTGPSQFCETLAKIKDCVTDPLKWFCNIFVKSLWIEGGNFDISPNIKVPYFLDVMRNSRHSPTDIPLL